MSSLLITRQQALALRVLIGEREDVNTARIASAGAYQEIEVDLYAPSGLTAMRVYPNGSCDELIDGDQSSFARRLGRVAAKREP